MYNMEWLQKNNSTLCYPLVEVISKLVLNWEENEEDKEKSEMSITKSMQSSVCYHYALHTCII